MFQLAEYDDSSPQQTSSSLSLLRPKEYCKFKTSLGYRVKPAENTKAKQAPVQQS